MAVPSTKLHVPSSRHALVPRPRLRARLDPVEVPLPQLLLVSAPAGFGKTTFVSQWLASRQDVRSAWLSLDSADNDPRLFLTALLTSLDTASLGVGEAGLALLETSSQLPLRALMTTLVNDLDRLSDAIVVVLDDYHLIDDPTVHQALELLLEHLPGNVTVAICSREDPPLPLARLRSRGELVEVRAADLRFTPAEAGDFLNQVMGLDLADSDVTALEARTEGWAAGLQLAALSMRGQENPSAFIDAFAGSHRFVVDYLVEEVLRRQPDDVNRFLLDTAVLDRMTGSLCDALTGRSDGQEMLEALERGNMFVVPLDDHRHWYRYHHLFADALRVRALTGEPARGDELHRRASAWYAAHGQPDAAIGHALAAGDAEAAADLVEQALPENRRERRDQTLRSWLERLPADVVRRRPVLSTFTAWTRLTDGDLDGAEALLDDVEEALGAMPPSAAESASTNPELARLPGTIAVYRAALAQARGDTEGTATQARRAWELADPEDHLTRSGGAGFLALSRWASGDVESAVDTFAETVVSLRAAGFLADELGTTVPMASMWLARGRPDKARGLYARALEVALRQPAVMSSTGDLHVGLADLLREQDDLEGAEQHLQAAGELGDAASLLENRHRWALAKAGLEQARGDLEAAARLVEEAHASYLPGFFPDVRPLPAALARVRIAQGRLDEAFAWAREHDVTTDQVPAFRTEFDQLTLARLLIAHQREHDGPDTIEVVLGLLDRLLEAAAGSGRDGSVIEIHLLAALAHHARGSSETALSRLQVALARAVPVGYRRLFLDEGAPMQDLLRLARQQPATAAHATVLLAGTTSTAPTPAPGQEPLSQRELEVLRLLATTLTGPDIARRLYLSVNTFRTHTRHIFTKLDVNTRAAAVRRATDLGLL